MKKNRLFMISALLTALTFAFASLNMNAQEKKEEKKVIKLKLQAEDDGTVSIDTTIILEGDFDGDWKDRITDEDLKKKIEEIEINLQADDDGNVIIMSTGSSGQKYVYVTTTKDEDGEINVEVKKVSENIMIEEIEGDSGKTYIIKYDSEGDDEGNVMIWHSDGQDDDRKK